MRPLSALPWLAEMVWLRPLVLMMTWIWFCKSVTSAVAAAWPAGVVRSYVAADGMLIPLVLSWAIPSFWKMGFQAGGVRLLRFVCNALSALSNAVESLLVTA